MHGRYDPAGGVLPPPPALQPADSLFLDFDGTLVDLAARPDAVRVDGDLRRLLDDLIAVRQGRVALVSGRSLADLDGLLGSDLTDRLALAGSHGVELRAPHLDTVESRSMPATIAAATAELAAVAAAHDLVFERKTLGAALHYRLAPAKHEAALAGGREIAARHGLHLQLGKMMVEVRAPGDKGEAVSRLMAMPPFAGTRPLFVGDDVTDEAGFVAAAHHGGAGILVGEARDTAALFNLPGVAAVRAWLAA